MRFLLVGLIVMLGLAAPATAQIQRLLPANGKPAHAGGSWRLTAATLGLLALSLLLAVAASPMKRYTDAAAAQLADRAGYAQAVLGPVGGAAAVTTRPYRAGAGEVILPTPGGKP